jgi:hypothetical protein
MLQSLKPNGGRRWPRGQRFHLTASGAAAEEALAGAIREARAQGRAALETAQARWAEPHRLQAGDGVVLAQLRQGGQSLAEVAEALADCGCTRAEVKLSLDRLVDRALAEPLPLPAQAAV